MHSRYRGRLADRLDAASSTLVERSYPPSVGHAHRSKDRDRDENEQPPEHDRSAEILIRALVAHRDRPPEQLQQR